MDFSFGESHEAIVVDLPCLLGGRTIRLHSYPLQLTLAEKIATMMSRGELNTRDRDFADVWVLSRLHPVPAVLLRASLHDVAARRGHDLVPLADALREMPDRQRSYEAMLKRMSYQRVLPARWTAMVDDVKAFVDPLLGDDRTLSGWNPDALSWQP